MRKQFLPSKFKSLIWWWFSFHSSSDESRVHTAFEQHSFCWTHISDTHFYNLFYRQDSTTTSSFLRTSTKLILLFNFIMTSKRTETEKTKQQLTSNHKVGAKGTSSLSGKKMSFLLNFEVFTVTKFWLLYLLNFVAVIIQLAFDHNELKIQNWIIESVVFESFYKSLAISWQKSQTFLE